MFRNSIKSRADGGGLAIPVVVSVLGSAVVLLLMLALCSFLATMVDMPQNVITPLATTCIAIAAFINGLIFSGILGKNGMVSGAIIGFVMFALLLAVALIYDLSEFTAAGFIKLLLLILAGAFGGFCGVTLKERGFGRKRR